MWLLTQYNKQHNLFIQLCSQCTLVIACLNCSYVIHITTFHDTRRQNDGVKLQHYNT